MEAISLEDGFQQLMSILREMRPLFPTYAHLVVSAIFPIYIAAHASLRRPPSAAPAKKTKSKHDADLDSDDEDESSHPIETLSTSDAVLFPILAGLTLTGLYVVIKWLEDPAILNKILGYYFSWVGTFFTFKFAKDVFSMARSIVFPTQFSFRNDLYVYDPKTGKFGVRQNNGDTIPNATTSGLFGRPTRPVGFLMKLRRTLYSKVTCTFQLRKPLTPGKAKLSFDVLDLSAILASVIVGLLPSFVPQGKVPWYFTNLQGFSFCYGSMQFMSPGTSATGTLLLSLLFIYDIYMVFYTPMMVTVATKLDVPIKLLFPRPEDESGKSLAMLGLGDIVVPGIMIAFALRFDLYRHYLNLNPAKSQTAGGQKSKEENRPSYLSARGMWTERLYTSRKLWSDSLRAKAFSKPYFKATVVGYLAGLIATLLVMQVYKHAQPALLYLVPGVLSSFWGMALWKGEIKLLWDYDEAIEEKTAEKEKEKTKQGDGKANNKTEEKDQKKDKEDENDEKAKTDSAKKESKVSNADSPQSVFSFHVYLPSYPRDSTSGSNSTTSSKTASASENSESTG